MIDDQTTRFHEVVGEVDVVFDTVGGETRERCWDVLNRGGHLVSILGQPAADSAHGREVRPSGVLVRPGAGRLAEIAR